MSEPQILRLVSRDETARNSAQDDNFYIKKISWASKPCRYALERVSRHVGGQFAAYAFEVSLKLLRACESGLYVRQHIFRSDVVEESVSVR